MRIPVATVTFLLLNLLFPFSVSGTDSSGPQEIVVRIVGDAIYVQPICDPDPNNLESVFACTDPFWWFRCRPGPDGPVLEQPPLPTVRLDGCYFDAAEVHARVGDTITWTNVAQFSTHKVTTDFDNPPAVIDSGPIEPGQSYSYTLTVPGVYRYHCAFHHADHSPGALIVDP